MARCYAAPTRGWNPDFYMLHGFTMVQQCALHVSVGQYCPFCTFCILLFCALTS